MEQFIRAKAAEQKEKYDAFLTKLDSDNMTLDDAKQELVRQGQDPSRLDYKEFNRDALEDTLAPGRKRINGDRNSRIQILQRQLDVPNNSQKPRLNEYILPFPDELHDLLMLLTEAERESWKEANLVASRKDIELGCKLPFFEKVVEVRPTIYQFPDKEVDVEQIAGLK